MASASAPAPAEAGSARAAASVAWATSAPNAGQIVEGLKREDLFTVVSDHVLTDTARHADIVLPATMTLERDDIGAAGTQLSIYATAFGLNALGGAVRELPDGLEITPRPLHGGSFATYHDHRLAMAGALLGLRVPGIEVQDIATTAKTMPDFPALWHALLGGGS